MASEKDLTLTHEESLAKDAKLYTDKVDDVEIDPAIDPEYRKKEKKLVRKLDMTLMPMVWILYFFNYLDRNNIA